MSIESPTSTTPSTSLPSEVTGIIVVTDATSDDPDLFAAHDTAAGLAARHHVPVVLYDRAEETWGDTEHPRGPLSYDDPRLEDRDDLRSQMARVASNGVATLAWISTLPSISSVATAVADIPANVVVVPDAMSRRWLERAVAGTSLAEELRSILDRNPALDVAVLAADGAGTLTLVE